MKLALLACLLCSALGFTPSPRLLPSRAPRTPAPATMQFGKFLGGNKQFTSSNADERKKRSDFYDDERDTVNRRDYMPNFVEQSEENDLATQGLGLYAAFIPFLLFVLAYSNGLLGFGYSNGNF